jgi:hypothetical protein
MPEQRDQQAADHYCVVDGVRVLDQRTDLAYVEAELARTSAGPAHRPRRRGRRRDVRQALEILQPGGFTTINLKFYNA